MGIGVETVISDSDLPLIRDMGSDPGDEFIAVDIESRMPPGEEALRPFGAQQLLVDKKPENLPGKKLSRPRVVDARDLMEEAGPIHPALGHQEMEVGIDPGSEGLNDSDDPGHQIAFGYDLEITCQ